MREDSAPLDLPFLRQRRNLIIGAIVILLLETTIAPPTELSLPNFKLSIRDPALVIYWLWILTTYWLIRYFQYLPSVEDLNSQLRFAYHGGLRRRLKQHATAHQRSAAGHASFQEKEPQRSHFVLPQHLFVLSSTYNKIRFHYNHVSWYNELGIMQSTNTRGAPEVTVTGLKCSFYLVLAAVDVCIRTPLFTEYVIPLIVFIAAAAASVHRLF